MVLPLIPIALAGGAGILGTLVGGIFADGSKKNEVSEIHAAKEHYAPITTDARSLAQTFSPTYQYQIHSPEASMVSKKTASAVAESMPSIAPSRTQEGGAGIASVEGMDMTKIAVIGVVGLVAYGLVSKK